MFLFPFEDVHTRNHESFPINFRSSPVTIDDTSHLAATLVQEVPADSGNFPWYMTDSIVAIFVTVFLCKHELWKCTYRSRKTLGGGGGGGGGGGAYIRD